MLSKIISIVWGLVRSALARLIGGAPADPSAVDLAASNATAQTELAQQETTHAADNQADAVRITADTGVLRAITEPDPSGIDATTNAILHRAFPGQFRD